jgi:hypothetical protein
MIDSLLISKSQLVGGDTVAVDSRLARLSEVLAR